MLPGPAPGPLAGSGVRATGPSFQPCPTPTALGLPGSAGRPWARSPVAPNTTTSFLSAMRAGAGSAVPEAWEPWDARVGEEDRGPRLEPPRERTAWARRAASPGEVGAPRPPARSAPSPRPTPRRGGPGLAVPPRLRPGGKLRRREQGPRNLQPSPPPRVGGGGVEPEKAGPARSSSFVLEKPRPLGRPA